jgi:Glycosyl hydrolases family 2, TIM barrel domain
MNTAVTTTDISGEWRLWFDDQAEWQQEPIYLPGTTLSEIVVNLPTGGWPALDAAQFINIPAVTEEIRADYHGVSWWSCAVRLTGRAAALLHFCAVRLRAEIFLDGELIGYDIEGYTPFEVAIPPHLNAAGTHRLDIRVTNPGGSDNWEDLNPIHWSGLVLPSSQDFGGIWQSVYLVEHDGMRIADLWVVCDVDAKSILLNAEIEGVGCMSACITVYAPDKTEICREVFDYGERQKDVMHTITLDDIVLHGLHEPNLYRVNLTVTNEGLSDSATKSCGFRKLAASASGGLAYNGQPAYLATSISWGLYFNGPIGTAEEIGREIDAVQMMGQNMLTAHRRPANPDLIDALDAAGIMLYQEPGGLPALRDRMGCGEWLAGDQLASAIAFAKLRVERLWRRDRSRASLVWWNLANECLDIGDGSPGEPAHELLEVARDMDDSRITTWTSGWGPGPAYQPFAHQLSASFDFHTVLNWPSMWHPQLDTEIAAVAPPEPMPYISGESQNFTSLGGLPELAQMARGRQVKRRFDATYIDWHNLLSKELATVDPEGLLGGAEGFCAATAAVQADGVARLVRHHRANPDCDGLAINGWHSHPLIGTMGILRVDRRPAICVDAVAAANAPIQIILRGAQYDIEAGQPFVCQPVILNSMCVAGLPVNLTLSLGNRALVAPIHARTDRTRSQSLNDVAVAIPDGAQGLLDLSIKGTIGGVAVEDSLKIQVTPKIALAVSGVHVFDPRQELTGLVSGRRHEWRMGSDGPALICANNLRLVQILFDGPAQRTAVLMRPELRATTNIVGAPGDLAKHGLASRDARFIDVKGDWNGGWAFSTGSKILPSFADALVWNSPYWHIFPRHIMFGLRGETITGATSFEGASLYETGSLRTGATTILLTKGRHEVLLTSLPLIEAAPRSPFARGILADIIAWLR